jgi:hypothetical protein
MRSPEQNAVRQVNFTQQLVDAIDENPPDNAVRFMMAALDRAGLRLAPAKDDRVAMGLGYLRQDMADRAKETLVDALATLIDGLNKVGQVAAVVALKGPCDDPECEACKAVEEVITKLEIDQVTDAVAHGHTLDEDCPVCRHDDAQ